MSGHQALPGDFVPTPFRVSLGLLSPSSDTSPLLVCCWSFDPSLPLFSMCIRGLGANTKFGAVVLTASTCGGAVIPALMSRVSDSRGLRYAFSVALAVFAFGSILSLYTTAVPAAKNQLDTTHHTPDSNATQDGAPTADSSGRVLSPFRKRKKKSAATAPADSVDMDKEKEPG